MRKLWNSPNLSCTRIWVWSIKCRISRLRDSRHSQRLGYYLSNRNKRTVYILNAETTLLLHPFSTPWKLAVCSLLTRQNNNRGFCEDYDPSKEKHQNYLTSDSEKAAKSPWSQVQSQHTLPKLVEFPFSVLVPNFYTWTINQRWL